MSTEFESEAGIRNQRIPVAVFFDLEEGAVRVGGTCRAADCLARGFSRLVQAGRYRRK